MDSFGMQKKLFRKWRDVLIVCKTCLGGGSGTGGQAASSAEASAFLGGFSHHLSGCSLLSLAGMLETTTSSWTMRKRDDLQKQKTALTRNLARTSGVTENSPAQHRNFLFSLGSDCFL